MTKSAPGPLLYATIFLLSLFEFVQTGMTAFAAAPIMGEVGMSPEEFSLVAALYASIAILGISMHRWVVERIGGRAFVQMCAGIAIFGAVLCAVSDDFATFLAGRAVMALGGGAFFTACRMIIQHRLVGPKRFVGIRCLASGLAIGIAAAPWLASIAVANETWTAMYWLIAALGVLIFLLAGFALDAAPTDTVKQRSHAEPWQQLLLVACSFMLLYALQRLYYDFYGDFLVDLVLLSVAAAGLCVYIHRQHDDTAPLLRLGAMLRVRYLTGLALFFFAFVMLGANNYMVPVMLQRTLGFAWETVGHVEALGFGVALLTWLVMSRLLPRYPAPRKFLATGFLALALFGGLLTRIHTGANLWTDVLPALAFNSIFLLTVLPVTAMQAFREMEHDETLFSNAQQVKNMMSQAGIALGVMLATVGQQWRTAEHYSALGTGINPYNPIYIATLQQLQQSLTAAGLPGDTHDAALGLIAQMLLQQSAMLAHIDHFGVIACLGVAGIFVVWAQRVFR